MVTPLPIHGVDTSHYQDWRLDLDAAKKAGVQFWYHRCTEGTTLVDSFYSVRRIQAADAKIPFGAYHFARPDPGDAAQEAAIFVEKANIHPNDLRPALDLETDEGLSLSRLDTWARTFCLEVKRLTGFDPIVYTRYDLPSVAHLPLWVARYNDQNYRPVIPPAWKQETIWQFSDGIEGTPKTLPGFGNVDLNTFGPGMSLSDILITPPKIEVRGAKVDAAIDALEVAEKRAKDGSERDKLIKRAIRVLKKIKPKDSQQ